MLHQKALRSSISKKLYLADGIKGIPLGESSLF